MNRLIYTICSLLCMLSLSSLFSQPKVNLQTFAMGFTRPVDIASAGDDRLFVVEQGGKIFIANADGSVNTTPFLDIDADVRSNNGELGLLGLVFHPDYENNGYFYVNYTAFPNETRIVRFTVDSQNPDITDLSSEERILTFSQPFDNHNGGDMSFGADGYLYISSGDGGSGNDPQDNGQKTTSLLGKILRIDVDNGLPYSIPADNPFVNEANVRDEIWSLGWRNPWRFSFDRQTQDMWIADVGQNVWEEVSFEPANTPGLNYGWRCYEGDNEFDLTNCGAVSDYVGPIFEYRHNFNVGFSVTGGFVYRGSDHPALAGHYVFGDYNSGRFWTIFSDGNNGWDTTQQGQLLGRDRVSTFGEDAEGEIYVADLKGGVIYKIIDISTGILPGVDALPVKLYPHPFKEELRVEFDNPDSSVYTLRLMDSQGRLVRELKDIRESSLKLDRGNLSSGLYFLELRGEKLFSGKVLVE
ncbi:MAG: PQQ-dependent sugar dehydrogenase [Bacteroidota bacterium]